MASDKAYEEVRHGIDARHRDKLGEKHIRFFEISQLEAAVSLEEQDGQQTIDTDKHPVSTPVVGQNYRFAVVSVPCIGENSRKNAKKYDCSAERDKSFVSVSFTVHNYS